MTEHPNVTAINRMTKAVFDYDQQTLAELFSEDIVFHVRGPLPCAGDHTGVDGFLGALGTLFRLTDGDVKLQQLFCLAEGPWAAEWEDVVYGRDGRRLETKDVFLYRFDGDRIAEIWMLDAAPPDSASFWE